MVLQAYRDIALLKALYWRMFSYFRWLMTETLMAVPQSPIVSSLRAYIGFSDGQLFDVVTQKHQDAFVSQNLAVLDSHIKKYMPAFINSGLEANEFHHLNPE